LGEYLQYKRAKLLLKQQCRELSIHQVGNFNTGTCTVHDKHSACSVWLCSIMGLEAQQPQGLKLELS
jgi:hypothetical protein